MTGFWDYYQQMTAEGWLRDMGDALAVIEASDVANSYGFDVNTSNYGVHYFEDARAVGPDGAYGGFFPPVTLENYADMTQQLMGNDAAWVVAYVNDGTRPVPETAEQTAFLDAYDRWMVGFLEIKTGLIESDVDLSAWSFRTMTMDQTVTDVELYRFIHTHGFDQDIAAMGSYGPAWIALMGGVTQGLADHEVANPDRLRGRDWKYAQGEIIGTTGQVASLYSPAAQEELVRRNRENSPIMLGQYQDFVTGVGAYLREMESICSTVDSSRFFQPDATPVIDAIEVIRQR